MNLELAILAIVCFMLRAWPRLAIKLPTSSDTHFHLFFAKILNQNSGRVPVIFDQIVIPHKADYPYFYHWILSTFSSKAVERIERFTSPLSDTLIMLLIPIVAKQCGFNFDHKNLIVICAIYTFYPGLFRGSSGPRAFSGCPRVMGQFLYLLHIVLYVHYFQSNQMWALIACLIIGATLPLTAKFGTQVLFFFLPVIVFASPFYLLVFVLTMILSYILSGKNLLTVLGGQYRHSCFYFKYMQKNFLWPSRLSAKNYLKNSLRVAWISLKTLTPKPVLNYIFGVRQPLNTLLFIFPFHVYFFFDLLASANYLSVWVSLISASILWFILTSFKHLAFIGESERYLEYSLVPCLIFVVPHFIEYLIYFIPIMALISLWLGFEYFKNNKQRSEDLIELRKILTPIPLNEVIWPIGSFHHTSLYLSNARVISFGANLDENVIGLDTYRLIYENAPYPSGEVKTIMENYHPSWVLTDRAHYNHYKNKILRVDMADFFERHFRIKKEFPSGLILFQKI